MTENNPTNLESRTNDKARPTKRAERIVAIDVLRGFALLGILLMNVQGFSMIQAAYQNPTAYGDLTGWNRAIWIFSHIFADQKFMTIFSLLFGAGIILFTDRLEAKGRKPASIHYRRTFWLFLIGLAHAYLLWVGDILVTYALCSFIVYLLRKRSPRTLFILGCLAAAVPILIYLFFQLSLPFWANETSPAEVGWLPTPAQISAEVAHYQGGWLEQMVYRIPSSFFFQTFVFFIYVGWRAGGLMLIGMACYKWGVVTAKRSQAFYWGMVMVGLMVGLPPIIYGVDYNFGAGWAFEVSMFGGYLFNYCGSFFVSMAYIGLIMLVSQRPKLRVITHPLSAVGQMALTNYLMQTLICTFIFYGHGLGLFGQVARTSQLLLVLTIWVFQLIISPIWLRYFRFGPFEWLWRVLTYWQVQPIRR